MRPTWLVGNQDRCKCTTRSEFICTGCCRCLDCGGRIWCEFITDYVRWSEEPGEFQEHWKRKLQRKCSKVCEDIAYATG